jgi:hypothetical protein
MAITSRSASALIFAPDALLQGTRKVDQPSPLPGGVAYETTILGDGIEYRFPQGALEEFAWLSTDFLVEGNQIAAFTLRLREGETGPEFTLLFSMLNQCQARLRFPLSAVDQNVWLLGREAALIKRLCGGDRVDLARVDRIQLRLERHGLQHMGMVADDGIRAGGFQLFDDAFLIIVGTMGVLRAEVQKENHGI